MFIPFLAGTAHSSCNYLYLKFEAAFRVRGHTLFFFLQQVVILSQSNVTCRTNLLYQFTQALGSNFL